MTKSKQEWVEECGRLNKALLTLCGRQEAYWFLTGWFGKEHNDLLNKEILDERQRVVEMIEGLQNPFSEKDSFLSHNGYELAKSDILSKLKEDR